MDLEKARAMGAALWPQESKERRGALRRGLVAVWLVAGCLAASLLPAAADDLRQPVLAMARSDDLGIAHEPLSARAIFTDSDPLPRTVLATQRGGDGGSVSIPATPTAQPLPAIILWDEFKPQVQKGITAADGQSSNQITIRSR